ncbi:hypothetical protein EDB83DRAFT_2322652 [Lactarius deliciosus]|nr:hypothetical protein EDB83DRAFT_2322652 [Lactarius deliciosus]
MALTSQRGAVATQHIAGRRTSSDVLDDPSLPSPFHVLDGMPPTEHHLLPLAPTPGPPRPPLSSAPDPGAVVEGEGSAGAEAQWEVRQFVWVVSELHRLSRKKSKHQLNVPYSR